MPFVRWFLRVLRDEPTGIGAGLLVLGACAVATGVSWGLLGLPGRLLTKLLPTGDCQTLSPGTFSMYVCSAKVGAFTVAAPLALVVLLVLARVRLRSMFHRLAALLPPEARFLVAPLATTLVFTVYWSAAHAYLATGAPEASGLVSITRFPAVVGLLTFLAMRYAPFVQRLLDPAFAARDRLPRWSRRLAALATPLAFAVLTTLQNTVTAAGTREQVIVVFGLALAYMLFLPRRMVGRASSPAARA